MKRPPVARRHRRSSAGTQRGRPPR